MKYRLKKDLPFAKAGGEVIKHRPDKADLRYINRDVDYVWCVGAYEIGDNTMDMSDWIEAVEKIVTEKDIKDLLESKEFWDEGILKSIAKALVKRYFENK